jgi:nitric oxide dioxygenase
MDQSPEIFSLVLAPVEGKTPGHRTGQYVAIAVDLPGGERQPRQYTISSGPRGDSLRVTIKRPRRRGHPGWSGLELAGRQRETRHGAGSLAAVR